MHIICSTLPITRQMVHIIHIMLNKLLQNFRSPILKVVILAETKWFTIIYGNSPISVKIEIPAMRVYPFTPIGKKNPDCCCY